MKNERGITLITLIVTVLLMIIVAGATITILFNKDNMINQVQLAVDRYKNEEARTNEELSILGNKLAEYIEGSHGDNSEIGGGQTNTCEYYETYGVHHFPDNASGICLDCGYVCEHETYEMRFNCACLFSLWLFLSSF